MDGNGSENDRHLGQNTQKARWRKHRIIFHTSPFLRCIQTSVAIAAGITEAQTALGAASSVNAKPHAQNSAHPMHSGSPHIRAMEHWSSPQLSAISEPEEFGNDEAAGQARTTHPYKPLLRTDAFLGEWLSQGYYEDITHPPDSVLMVAAAKATLLREKTSRDGADDGKKKRSAVDDFSGGWSGGGTFVAHEDTDDNTDGSLISLADIDSNPPKLNRSSSYGSPGSEGRRFLHRPQVEIERVTHSEAGVYVSPAPSYAISPLAPIPPGYFAHAKEACVNVDYQWDSMRPPQDWGNGGQYPEEWSSMHKRFRRGLQQMLLWYGQQEQGRIALVREEEAELSQSDGEGEEDTDLVLILITHSAGCNALIGALTNQPVLLDPGITSLTMAVRRPGEETAPAHSPEPMSPGSRRRRSSVDLGISEHYEVQIMASTDHLRSGSVTTSRQSASVSSSYNPSRYRSSSDGKGSLEPEGLYMARGGLQRSSSAATPRSTGLWSKPIHTTPAGLWGTPPRDSEIQHKAAHGDSPLRESTSAGEVDLDEKVTKHVASLQLGKAQLPKNGGLWGSPRSPPSTDREKGLKRRWTHSEQR